MHDPIEMHVNFFCECFIIYCYYTTLIVMDSVINYAEINEIIPHAKILRFWVFSSEFLRNKNSVRSRKIIQSHPKGGLSNLLYIFK